MAITGLTNIQVHAQLIFDDGVIISISTPIWRKDVRDGEFFSDEMTQEVVTNAGQALADIIGQEGLKRLHNTAVVNTEPKRWNNKPSTDEPFSVN